MEEKKPFIIYEYLNIPVKQSMETLYIDCYKSFGWQIEGMAVNLKPNVSELKLKRDRRIRNREEIRELQKQFEVALLKLEKMERLKTSKGTIIALGVGLMGTAFLAGAVFAYLAGRILLCVILAIPGLIGCILPYFCYRRITAGQNTKMEEQIERQYDIIYRVCERANALISDDSNES